MRRNARNMLTRVNPPGGRVFRESMLNLHLLFTVSSRDVSYAGQLFNPRHGRRNSIPPPKKTSNMGESAAIVAMPVFKTLKPIAPPEKCISAK